MKIDRCARAFVLFVLMLSPMARSWADEPKLLDQPRGDYQARRQKLMKVVQAASATRIGSAALKEPVIVLRGMDDHQKEDFEEGRFRQTNDFAYLTGIEIPGAYLVLQPRTGGETLYLPPERPKSRMNVESAQPYQGDRTAEAMGVARVESTAKLLADLFGAIQDPMRKGPGVASAAVLYTTRPEPVADATDETSKFIRLLREGAPSTSFRDLSPFLGEMRKAKSSAEIALLQTAIDVTGRAQDSVMAAIRPGLFEFQLEGKIMGAFLDGGAYRPGFKSIVGSGPNSTIPHYFLSSRRMNDGELVVVDIGAEYQLYTADITRTYPVNGKFTPRQREIYQLVLDAQSESARSVTPGKTRMFEMTQIARDYLRKSPLRAKDEEGREWSMDHFFIHGLGHYLGMDVHDVGDMTKAMQPGEVFTIEPGIYIKSENLGVRIEDDYLVTDHGLEKLSAKIPSEIDEIEKRIAAARGSDPRKSQ